MHGSVKIFFLLIIFNFVTAFGSVALDGPVFFRNNGPKRIYQAFDLAFTQIIERKQTFADEDLTPVIARLDAIKAKGYTHVQISPPQACTPSFSLLTPHKYCYKDIWYLPYQPYICILDVNYKKELSDLFDTTEDLRPQYGITLSDGTIIGYRLGNTRYGTAKQLKELVAAAKQKGLGIIADIVVNHVSPDHGGPSTYFKTMDISDLHPIRCKSTGFFLSKIDFPENFFHERGEGQYGLDTWDWGPDLNTGNATTQEMIVKYLKILSDLGITGLRIDAMKHIAANEFHEIFQKAKTLIGEEKFFDFGFGEVIDERESILSPYYPLAALEDVRMFSSIVDCFRWNHPMKSLIMPKGMANVPTVAFSTLHDNYPGVSSGKENFPLYPSGDHENKKDMANSHLAMAYLLARKDPSVLVIRFEDERDSFGIIERGLHFRNTMDSSNAPHEYTFTLGANAMILARQFGFAIINRGEFNYVVDKSIIRGTGNPFLSFYIPDGEYTDQFENKYNVPNINVIVPPRNACFLILQRSSDQECVDKIFEYTTETEPGQKAIVAGNHPLLGNYNARADGFNYLSNLKSYGDASVSQLWRSLSMRFPKGLPLKYHFAITSADGKIIKKEKVMRKFTAGGQEELPQKYHRSRVFFTLSGVNVSYGQNIYIVGNTEELGFWNVEQAIKMDYQEDGMDWVKSVFLPSDTTIQYKYIKRSPDNDDITWMGGYNLSLAIPKRSLVTEDVWVQAESPVITKAQ